MNFKEMIERGEKLSGGRPQLAKILDIDPNSVSDAKNGRRGMPDKACVKLAEIIGTEVKEVLKAKNLALGKDVDFWKNYGRAATVALIACNLILTPTPSEAAPIQAVAFHLSVLCQIAMLLAFRYQGAFARRKHATFAQQTGS